MRRPTRAQALARRSVLGLVVMALLLVVALVVTRLTDSSESTDRSGENMRTDAEPSPDGAPSSPSQPVPTSTTTAPWAPSGRFIADRGAPGRVAGTGTLTTYRVEVEDGSHVPIEDFTDLVEEIMSDPRGWTSAMGISLQRVTDIDADLTITLATPDSVDLLCAPLQTDGEVSCAVYGRAIINVKRWQEGAEPSHLSLEDYRRYLVNHEVGHVLGHHHVECPSPGAPAPVMMQQTLGIGDCAPNPWPVPEDRTG